MLGYGIKDIYDMQNAIDVAISYIPQNSSNDSIREGLISTSDLLEGLLAEGHIL